MLHDAIIKIYQHAGIGSQSEFLNASLTIVTQYDPDTGLMDWPTCVLSKSEVEDHLTKHSKGVDMEDGYNMIFLTGQSKQDGHVFDVELRPTSFRGIISKVKVITPPASMVQFRESKIRYDVDQLRYLHSLGSFEPDSLGYMSFGDLESDISAVLMYAPQEHEGYAIENAFPVGCYILEKEGGKSYWLQLMNEIWETENLEELETRLYEYHRIEITGSHESVQEEDSPETRAFMCYWGEGYFTDKDDYTVEKKFMDFFDESNGYPEQDIQALMSLDIGQARDLSDPSGTHIVTRIK